MDAEPEACAEEAGQGLRVRADRGGAGRGEEAVDEMAVRGGVFDDVPARRGQGFHGFEVVHERGVVAGVEAGSGGRERVLARTMAEDHAQGRGVVRRVAIGRPVCGDRVVETEVAVGDGPQRGERDQRLPGGEDLDEGVRGPGGRSSEVGAAAVHHEAGLPVAPYRQGAAGLALRGDELPEECDDRLPVPVGVFDTDGSGHGGVPHL